MRSLWVSYKLLFPIVTSQLTLCKDVTDIVDYNIFCLNRASMADSFFYLSKTDPERGFACNLTSIAGCVEGTASSSDMDIDESPTYLRLLLGSHLAQYLRLTMEEKFGYTSTCGISTNKLLSKLVGGRNKPRLQTTLLALKDGDAVAFIDEYVLRKIPGVGFKTAQALESHVTSRAIDADSHSFESSVTAREVRLHPDISPGSLETLLIGPGAERGVGTRVWGLLHGVDPTEVKEANDIPTQISIEDTYKGLQGLAQITEELHKLSYSLVRRMRVDLVVPDENADIDGAQKWIAKPKTLRLSVRSYTPQGTLNYNSRVSRSGPLPNFIFSLVDEIDYIAERLVTEALLPLLRRLQPDRGHRWNLQMLNICVANMVVGAADDKTGAGRDISAMFKHQDEALRPWRVVSEPESEDIEQPVSEESDTVDDEWETPENITCPKCGHSIPTFAISAHTRYHEMDE